MRRSNPTPISPDVAAFRILAPRLPEPRKQAALDRLQEVLDTQLNGGPCPECGNPGPHDDNGAERRSDFSWCCKKCGEQWGPDQLPEPTVSW